MAPNDRLPSGGSGGTRAYIAGAVAVVLAMAGVWLFVLRDRLPLIGRRTPAVTYGISLVPDATGTLVEIVGETSDNSLPTHVEMELRTTDDASLTQGGVASGGRLRYSDVQDGLGTVLPAEQVRSGRLLAVGTDGRRLRLSFHVSSVEGNRVIYPIPRSADLTWVQARVYPQGVTVTCWADKGSENPAYAPCENPQGEVIDGGRHSTVRLLIQPT